MSEPALKRQVVRSAFWRCGEVLVLVNPGEDGRRELTRGPEGGVFERTGCELLRAYLELGALKATVDPVVLSLGTRLESVPSTSRLGAEGPLLLTPESPPDREVVLGASESARRSWAAGVCGGWVSNGELEGE